MINKVIVLTGMLLCMSAVANAQFKYGLKAGLNVSRIHHKSRWDERVFSFMPSAHVGFYTHMDISQKFFLSGEFLISDKGFKNENSVHLLYASIPVMANFRISKELAMGCGPELGILITPMGKDHEYLKEVYSNRLDVGGAISFQYTISRSLSLGLRWVKGFSNIIGKEANIPFYRFDEHTGILLSSDLRTAGFVQKNESFQLSIGYSL